MFVSVGGQKATIHLCPTPEQFHQRLWDDKWGRGGKFLGKKVIPLTIIESDDEICGTTSSEALAKDRTQSLITPMIEKKVVRPANDTFMFLGNRCLPNPRFERKHGIHPEDEKLPLGFRTDRCYLRLMI